MGMGPLFDSLLALKLVFYMPILHHRQLRKEDQNRVVSFHQYIFAKYRERGKTCEEAESSYEYPFKISSKTIGRIGVVAKETHCTFEEKLMGSPPELILIRKHLLDGRRKLMVNYLYP